MILRCIIYLLFAVSLKAANWYIDNSAAGLRNGTSWANAWTNVGNVNGISAGDTVYISGGTTSKTYKLYTAGYNEWVPANNGNGVEGSRIVYKVGQDEGHNGFVICDGTGANAGGGRLKLQNWKHGTISGDYNGTNHLIFTNCTGLMGDGANNVTVDHVDYYREIRFNGCYNIELSFCYIKPQPLDDAAIKWGVGKLPADPESYTNNTIHNCTVLMPVCDLMPAWGADGIQWGENSSVYSNLFTVYYVTNNTEWQHTDGWQNSGSSNCKIYNNIFENIANYALYWECSVSVRNVLIFNNIFRHNSTLTRAQTLNVGIVLGPQQVNGLTFSNVVVANNTFADFFGRVAIGMGQLSTSNVWTNSYIINNLFINSNPLQFYDNNGTNGLTIAYNKADPGVRGTTTFTPAQLVNAGGSSNITFVYYSELSVSNDLNLSAGDQAAIGRGINLSSIFTADILGNPRGSSWDIGAYQYTNSSPIIIPTNVQPQRLFRWTL